MRYWYYPGCSLHSTASEYNASARAVCTTLGAELIELPDWNCCGASSVHSLCSTEAALALPARNVMLAQREPLDIVIPCADCFYHSTAADRKLREDQRFRAEMETLMGLKYKGRGRPRPLLEVLTTDMFLEQIATQTQSPLTGLRPASYYGCLLVRPPKLAGQWDDPEHPTRLDRLLAEAGASPVRWSYAVECCGASLAISHADIVARLAWRIVAAASEAGANCLVTACPMCQANLDSRQGLPSGGMPVFYFTELLGLALGLRGAESWFKRHLIDPRPLLRSIRLEMYD